MTLDLPQGEELPHFTMIAAPVTATVRPTTATNLQFDDVQGLPTIKDVPAGAVTSTSLLMVTPTLGQDSGNDVFVGHAFVLDAAAGWGSIDTFLKPLDIEIAYSDLDIRYVAREDQLWLRWWDGNEYQDAIDSCVPSSQYLRDESANVIAVSVCQSGEYTLMGPAYHIFLPFLATIE